MSIKLMTLAWDIPRGVLPSARKFVLVALCDQANDTGECYPSVAYLATKCDMSERAMQGHLSALEADGFLTRRERNGRSTVYKLSTTKLANPLFLTPAESAPPPAESAPITITYPLPNHDLTQEIPANQPAADNPTSHAPNGDVCKGNGNVNVKQRRKKPMTSLPVGFCISESVQHWANEQGHTNLQTRLMHFTGWAMAKDAKYADWDQAFMNAIRDDWAKLNGKPNRQPPKPRRGDAGDTSWIRGCDPSRLGLDVTVQEWMGV